MNFVSQFKTQREKGFTYVEVLVVLAILLLLTGALAYGLGGYSRYQQYKAEVSGVAESFIDQQNKSLAGINNSSHGFYISSTTITLFEGEGYTAGDSNNEVTELQFSLATSSLSNGTTTVFFNNFTGTSSATGTIQMYNPDLPATTTITIYESGNIEF